MSDVTIREDAGPRPAETSASLLRRLTPRHAAFSLAAAGGMSAADAARYAGAPAASARQRGHELLQRPDVRAAINALQAEAAEGQGLDLATLLRQLAEDRRFAYELGAPAAAIRATELQARLSGVLNMAEPLVEVHVVDLGGLSPDRSKIISAEE